MLSILLYEMFMRGRSCDALLFPVGNEASPRGCYDAEYKVPHVCIKTYLDVYKTGSHGVQIDM